MNTSGIKKNLIDQISGSHFAKLNNFYLIETTSHGFKLRSGWLTWIIRIFHW